MFLFQHLVLVPAPYGKYLKPDSAPYTAAVPVSDRHASASSTTATYVDGPKLISPIVYGYSYGSKYNNMLTGLPALQLAARGAEPGFYGKRPEHPGLKGRSLSSRGDFGIYKDIAELGFFRKT